ncbi:alanine racemase [Phycisphaerales bacterium AB-hyl4]|uniref:Alanine racemase n=1 Tax=Natronomicrosphaera hydrolytica TaxID=3242702 RepID=A0ABV4U1D3_9BACT
MTTRNPTAGTQPLSRLEIDLGRLEANLHALRQAVAGPGDRGQPAVKICAAMKKNGYGLGAVPLAARLVKAGCDMLAVYSPEEAEQLIRQAVAAPLLLLMPVRKLTRTDLLYRHAMAGKLHLTVHDLDQLDAINQIGRTFSMRMPVHLYLDTGMSRSGLSEADLRTLADRLQATTHIQIAGLYTHLASADVDVDFTREQFARFQQSANGFDPATVGHAIRHAANTFATLRDRDFHLDMVRTGLGLFGYGPDLLQGEPRLADMPQLQPIVRWVSRVIHVQQYPAGATVGYGATHRLHRESTLGVIPVGYGDGYPLALSNRGVVRLRLQSGDTVGDWLDVPVVGRVNMDQIVVDLTAAGRQMDAHADAFMHAEAELISDEPAAPNALPRLAELAGSHCYEMLCRLGTSLPRVYRQ